MTSSQTCQKCGSQLGRSAPGGLCAGCMFETGLSGSLDWLTDDVAEEFPVEVADGAVPGRFSHYEVLEELGRGGMGIVFRARDVTINRLVALKMIVSGQFASKREVDRFRAEAGAAARLDHPNIVPIYEVGEEDGRPFFSMKLMEGGTLTERLKASGSPMPAREAANLVVKIAHAIHHAHQRAILHRDIKPGNVLLDAQGEPHVSDFGLAKCLDSSESMTLSGAMLGSPSYMSPEQAAGQVEQLTTACDTYSLGALLYQLLTSRPPFEAATPLATMEKVLRQEPLSPGTIHPGTDPDLETICLKCLEKDPQQRYASADALALELERWLRGEPIQARPCPAPMRLWKWARRQPQVALLALVAILAIVAFVAGQTIMSVRVGRANKEVHATNTRLSASLHEFQWRKADDAARAGERDEAIAWLSYFLRQNPHDSGAAARLLSLLSAYNFPLLLHPPLVHESPLVGIEFDRAGARLLCVCSAGTKLWNAKTGLLEAELVETHGTQLTGFALGGAKDQRLLTISAEPKGRIWDLGRREVLKEFSLGVLPPRSGRHVTSSRDRRLMALKVESNSVAVLDAEAATWLGRPQSMADEIRSFALSEDGRLLATATSSEVQLWEAGNEQQKFPAMKLDGAPAMLHFSEDGRWLVWASGGKLWVLSAVSGERESEFQVKDSTRIVFVGAEILVMDQGAGPEVFNFRTGKACGSAFARADLDWLGRKPLSAYLFSSRGADRQVCLDPATGQPRTEPYFHEGWIADQKVHPSGKIATASQDRTVRIWSVEMGRAEPITIRVGDAAWEAQWSPSGERILSISQREGRHEMRLWEGQTGEPVTPPRPLADVVYFAQWSSDGSRFATASGDHTAQLWDGKTGEPISPPLRHDSVVFDCTFSPDGRILATGESDRTVRLWDAHTGKALGQPLLHTSVPMKTRFSADGRRIATACYDGSIRVWSVPDGIVLVEPSGHDGTCLVAAFSPDDRLLASASTDGTVRLWDPATGKPVLPPLRHEGPVLWASFSPNGQAIASSSEAGLVRLWSTANGQPLSEPMRHPDKVWTVKWSPDGKFLGTVCMDGSARIWDAFNGHLVAEPFAHQKGKEVRRMGFSPDGRRLLTSSFDGTMKIWDLTYLRPPVPAPDWLPELAEALGGKRIGVKDVPEPVPGQSLQSVQDRIAQAPAQDYYTRWAKWMLKERFEQPVRLFRP